MNQTAHKYLRMTIPAILDSIAVRQFEQLLLDPPDPILTPQELDARVQQVMERIESEKHRTEPDVSAAYGEENGLRWIRVTVDGMRKYTERLQQLISFDIENTLTASPVRGHIERSAENAPESPRLDDRLHKSDWIPLDVEPDGPGIYRCVLKLNGETIDVPPNVNLTIANEVCEAIAPTVDADGFLEFLFETDARWVTDGTTTVETVNGNLHLLSVRIFKPETPSP